MSNKNNLSAEKHVLILEDNADLISLLQEMIEERTSGKITSVSEANAALTLLRKQSFNVLICDLHLPGMSGPEFLSICKQEKILPKDVMIISGDIKHPDLDPEMIKDFICLEKPFFVETFPDLIKKILDKN